MDPHKSLLDRAYYNNYSRKFPHYYDIYYTNIDKIDRIMVDSMRKGYEPKEVMSALDEIWESCRQRERNYQADDGKPFNTQESYFESYLRNVIRKILVFDEFDLVFTNI